MVDNTRDNLWSNWYRQRVEMLWSTLNLYQDTGLTMQDKRILFRSRECLPELFRDFNDNAVLVHGNFTLRSMLKDPRSDQLLAMVGPGMMLWAPREYELFRLAEAAGRTVAVALPAAGASFRGLCLAALALSAVG